MRDKDVRLAMYTSIIAIILFIGWALVEFCSIKVPVLGFIIFGIPVIYMSLMFWKELITSFVER